MTLLVLGILEVGHIPALRRLDAKVRMRSVDEPGPE